MQCNAMQCMFGIICFINKLKSLGFQVEEVKLHHLIALIAKVCLDVGPCPVREPYPIRDIRWQCPGSEEANAHIWKYFVDGS